MSKITVGCSHLNYYLFYILYLLLNIIFENLVTHAAKLGPELKAVNGAGSIRVYRIFWFIFVDTLFISLVLVFYFFRFVDVIYWRVSITKLKMENRK